MAAKKVVIVGGGAGGAILAYNLQTIADVTLIDSKEYYEIPWAEMRAMVEPAFANRSLIKHTDYLKTGKLIVSTAVNVTETQVLTADGQAVEYDTLVIATGHAYNTPKHINDRLDNFKQEYAKIKAASSVLIVGGGPTGVELAGEIVVDFPDKKVTIVHRGARLLEYITPKASKKGLDWLKSKGVEVLLEQSVDLDSLSDSAKTYTTSAGKKVTADIALLAIGKPTGSSWLQNSILGDSLNNKGQLQVDEYFKVKGKKNIYAIGDISDVQELKLGYNAVAHAGLVAKNYKLTLKGAKEAKLGKYKPAPLMSMVSLGRRQGLAQFPFASMIGRLPGMMKSKDLFVGSTRKNLGLEA